MQSWKCKWPALFINSIMPNITCKKKAGKGGGGLGKLTGKDEERETFWKTSPPLPAVGMLEGWHSSEKKFNLQQIQQNNKSSRNLAFNKILMHLEKRNYKGLSDISLPIVFPQVFCICVTLSRAVVRPGQLHACLNSASHWYLFPRPLIIFSSWSYFLPN